MRPKSPWRPQGAPGRAPVARAFGFVALVLAAALAQPVRAADPLPEPEGRVILTVHGEIGVTNADGEARFDRAMLNALGLHMLETTNPFEPGLHVFEGVLLKDVLARVAAKGATLTAKALDGYEIDLPVSDANDYDVLLAMSWNGETMTVREKGPIWVIYPIDRFPELNIEEYSSRSIWQLSRIRVW